MKQTITKISVVLITIILVAGAAMMFIKGLAFDLQYQDNQKIEVNLEKEFDKKDIKEIAKEVFENQPVMIQAIEVYKDTVSITTTEITEEQKNNFVSKINEKYQLELKAEDVEIENVPHVRGRDIIKPYIVPFIISTVIILIYLLIRYYKLNSMEILVQAIGTIGLAQLVLLALMAITRMPIGRFTIPTVILVYMLSLYACTSKFEKDLEIANSDNNKSKKKSV